MRIELDTTRPGLTSAAIYPEDRTDQFSSFRIDVTKWAGTLARVNIITDDEGRRPPARQYLTALRDASALAMEVYDAMNDPARLQTIAERVNREAVA